MHQPIKLYLLTGFLGAGKTTMLLSLLNGGGVAGKKIGVIQNEFGKLSIDGALLRRGDIQMREISNGSIFCSCLKLQFVSALAEMSKQGLDMLFVESSGLADPSNLEEILAAVEVLCADQPYTLAGTICLVDGVDFLENAADLETVVRQIVHCNIALLNKCDLISPARVQAVKEQIRQYNENCLIVETEQGRLDPRLLEQDLSHYQWAPGEASTNTVDTKPKTFSISFEISVPWEKLRRFLEGVLPDCYRIKGFCQTDIGWQQVDVVGDRIDRKPCQARANSQLVFISKTGIQLIRRIHDTWQAQVGLPVQLHN